MDTRFQHALMHYALDFSALVTITSPRLENFAASPYMIRVFNTRLALITSPPRKSNVSDVSHIRRWRHGDDSSFLLLHLWVLESEQHSG